MKLFQKTLLSVSGLAVVALTAGSLIASAQKPSLEIVAECLKGIEMQLLPAAEEVRLCGGTFQMKVAKPTSKYVSKAPVAQAPVEAPVVAPVENKGRCMTEECQAEQRLQEIINDCKAGVFENLSGEAAVAHCDKHYPIWRR